MPRPRRAERPDHPLTRWRKANKVTQQALADSIGVTQSMIAHIENYRHVPAHESLERLISVTGLPTDALIRAEHFLAEQPDFHYTDPPHP